AFRPRRPVRRSGQALRGPAVLEDVINDVVRPAQEQVEPALAAGGGTGAALPHVAVLHQALPGAPPAAAEGEGEGSVVGALDEDEDVPWRPGGGVRLGAQHPLVAYRLQPRAPRRAVPVLLPELVVIAAHEQVDAFGVGASPRD